MRCRIIFSFRYRGIKELIGRHCTWGIGRLFDFSDLDKQWRQATRPYVNHSVAKSALQLKFDLELEVTTSTGAINLYKKQLIWNFSPSAIYSEFFPDWLRIIEHPFVHCRAIRELVSVKGKSQSIDLHDVRTLLPTFDKDRGSLIPVYKKENDVERCWLENLKQSFSQKLITEQTFKKLTELFQQFVMGYKKSVTGFMQEGLACSDLIEQIKSYGNLIEAICTNAKGDKTRLLLLKPIINLGTAQIEGGAVTAIVAPWHPLRLAAMASKAKYITDLIRYLLTSDNVLFGDTRLYFEELTSELSHPFYPEIVLGWNELRPELLSLTDHCQDYSLHEAPIANIENHCDTNESPTQSANRR